MVRFANGTPTAVWYSQHSNGEAFTYKALNKTSLRVRTAYTRVHGRVLMTVI